MSLASEITIQQMIDGIKVEGRITGSDTLNVTILGIINELLISHTETERYSSFVTRDHVIPLTPGDGEYDLPDDFQNMKKVYWSRQGEPVRARVLNYKNDFVEESRDGREPKYYEIAGDQLIVFPYGDIKASDTLSIDYWRIPQQLNLDDKFPVSKLFPIIKKEAIARVLRYNDKFNADDRFMQNSVKETDKAQTTEDNSDS